MKNVYLKHLKTICKHKWYVFKECAACGLIWQGIIHDLSKFGITEFVSSARYFQGNRSPIEAEKEATGYSLAWLHHKGHNKHHWEYWTDFNEAKPNGDGTFTIICKAVKMPYDRIIEMFCDFVGAGKAYSKEAWTVHTPLEYWKKNRNRRMPIKS